MADFGKNMKNVWMKGMEAIGNAASNIASSTRTKVDEMNMVNRRSEIMKDFGAKAYALWQKGERLPEELENQLREVSRLDEQLNDLRAERLAGVKTAETQESAQEEPAPEEEEALDPQVDEAEEAPETDEAEAAEAVPVEIEDAAEEAAEQIEAAADAMTDEIDQAVQAGSEKIDEAVDAMSDGIREAVDAASDELEKAADAARDTFSDAAEKAKEAVPVIEVEKIRESAEKAASGLSSAINDLFEKAPTADEAAEKVNTALDSLGDGLKKFSDSMGQKIDDFVDRFKGGSQE